MFIYINISKFIQYHQGASNDSLCVTELRLVFCFLLMICIF